MQPYYFERALFIVGKQNSGKSTQLRSMFRDVRLSKNGKIPDEGKLHEVYRLSNERSLYIRLTSPHEAGEWIEKKLSSNSKNFFDKLDRKLKTETPRSGKRWNFACPLQPNAANHMPDVAKTVAAFVQRFDPERTRILFLSPDRHGTRLQAGHLNSAAALRVIPSVEVAWIDARDRRANGLLIADFFDFT